MSNSSMPGREPKAPAHPYAVLTSVAGAAAAFFFAPLLYGVTIDPVTDFADENYGDWAETLVKPLWFLLSGGGIYSGFKIGTHYLIDYLKFRHTMSSARGRRF